MSIPSSRVHARRMMMLAVLALGAALAASLVQAGKPGPVAPVKYTITQVPGISSVTGMNNVGDIVDGGTRLYDHLTGLHDLTGPVNSLLTSPVNSLLTGPNPSLTYVADINDAWKITGAFTDSSGVVHGFRCSLKHETTLAVIVADTLEILPKPEGTWGWPAAINNGGDVVGHIEIRDTPPECRAVLWPSAGGVIQLATVYSDARNISDADPDQDGAVKVTGFMYRDPDQRAFLYDFASGTTSDLGVLPRRTESEGFAVNSRGQVAGYSQGGGRPTHSFRYTPGVGMVDLGTLGGSDLGNHAASLNAAGQVVGTAVTRITNPFSVTGYLYTDANKMLDLALLISNPPASLKHLEPKVINDYRGHAFGQIAGTATVNGVWGVVLLTPDP